MDRRAFLGTLPLAGLTLRASADTARTARPDPATTRSTAAPRPGFGAGRAATEPAAGTLDAWGVQLYTLREALADDLDGTLAAVARIGYEEVELFQLHGLSPRELRARLDAVGLQAASSHYGMDALRDDLKQTVDGALELGQSLMVVASIPADERTAEGLARVADDLTRAGERARRSGLRVGYHNHDWELAPLSDGTLPIDLLLDRTDPDLVDWQMDIFWTVHGGGDPLAMLDRRAGRVTSVHVKDRTADGRMVDVGDGLIDFATIMARAEGQGLMHAFVEHDRPEDPIRTVRRSYRHLTSLAAGSPAGGWAGADERPLPRGRGTS
jgi:sugar phosphate isomerase/epimerase